MPLEASAQAGLIEAVRSTARDEILPRFRSLTPDDIASKSRHDDLVTVADKASEERLTRIAGDILPGVSVVGEEAVAEDLSVRDSIGTSDACLIIDPIDGTWNFAHGLPLFGVILAFAERGQTTWGLIYDPIGDDWVMAERGRGASLVTADGSTTPLSFNSGASPVSATMGYVHAYLFQGEERRRLFQKLPGFHKTDALRCSAHEYRLLAQGAVDFCLSPVLNPWDHAAGALIATEAGGVSKLLDGTPYAPTLTDGRLLTASSEDTWSAVARELADVC